MIRRGPLVVLTCLFGLALVGCSGDDADAGSSVGTDSRRRTTTSTGSDDSPSTISSSSSEPGGDATTTTPGGTPPGGSTDGGPPGPPTVAEGGGWRLGITHPTSGGTISPVTTLCTEVAGTSREPVVALEVTLREAGSSAGGETVRVDGMVGRGTVHVELPAAAPGRYDLSVQLIADGERIEGVAATISGVALVESAAEVTCS